MKFLALISGGKDSTFNILECLCQGHELVALANLHPDSNCGKDEIDSYMFQSVGHEVVQCIADSIGAPLYRSEILGSTISAELNYTETKGDEIEDLYQLLARVKRDIPDVLGVSSGAILSDYQRLRVENVCSRLGLISLAFLWRRSQTELIHNMVDCGIEPMIIKIAAYGLTEKSHLGRRIAEILPNLMIISNRNCLNPCGEGGEYETITLDAPYFSHSLLPDPNNTEVVTMDDNPFAAVKYVRFNNMQSHQKSDSEFCRPNQDFAYSQIARSLPISVRTNLISLEEDLLLELEANDPNLSESSDVASIALPNLQVVVLRADVESGQSASSVLHSLLLELLNRIGDISRVCYCFLCIPDMTDFVSINEVYSRHFPTMNPPSRSCIQASDTEISLAAVLTPLSKLEETEQSRRVLHVQSLSHWAPASIGPYAQAVLLSAGDQSTAGHCLLAGQIGMHPEDGTLATDVHHQMLLSVRHVSRLLSACSPSHRLLGWRHCVLVVCFCISVEVARLCRSMLHTLVCQSGACLCEQRLRCVVVPCLPKSAQLEITTFFSDQLSHDSVKDDTDQSSDSTNVDTAGLVSLSDYVHTLLHETRGLSYVQ